MTIGKSAFQIAKKLTPPILWDMMAASRRKAYARRASAKAFQHMEQGAPSPLLASRSFADTREAAEAIEGMFSVFSMAVIDTLLSLQNRSQIAGNMLEMGVYRGRSAALLGRWLIPSERLLLVDIRDHLDRRAIEPFGSAVDYFVQSTAEFRTKTASRLERGFRFIHIDASHEYRATFSELELADTLLGPRGIIAMDDFANLNYAQNIAAIFKYLHTSKTDLRIFLTTNEKAYLCRQGSWDFYASFALNHLVPEMVSREMEDVCIARTDVDPEFAAFYARTRQPGEQGHFYAPDLYSRFFAEP